MGFLKGIFGLKSPQKPVEPKQLLNEIPPTDVPASYVGGNNASVSYVPGLGTRVGLFGLDKLRDMFGSTNTKIYSMLPDIDKVTANELAAGEALGNYLYNQGAGGINANLQGNIKNFREDSFRRGLGASSSYLSGIKNLMGANASALADLRNESNMQGLQYAWDMANKRSDALKLLTGLNQNLYGQVNEFPLNLGLKYSIPQAELWDNNKQMNLDRLSNYYGIYNDAINAYNRSLGSYNNSMNNFYRLPSDYLYSIGRFAQPGRG